MAAIVAAPLSAPASVTFSDAALLLLFGALNLGLGLVLLVTGARLITATQTTLLGTLEPIAGPLWVWLFLNERPAALTLLGGAIVLAALIGHTVSEMQRPARAR